MSSREMTIVTAGFGARLIRQSFWPAAGGLLILAVVLLGSKNISLGSPIMAGDEYAYFALAREFPALDAIAAYDPTIQRTNNILYFSLGHFIWDIFPDPALAMRLLQSSLYCLMAVTIFTICRCFMGSWSSLALTVFAAATAMSSYTAYFMPETLYQLLFFLLAAAMVLGVPRNPMPSAGLCGLLVALLLLTKPHGVALAAAVSLTLLVCLACPRAFGIARRQSGAMLLTFGAVAYIAMVAINAALTHKLMFSPLLFVGSFYRTLVAPPTSVPSWSVLRPVLLGNGVAMAMLAGYPVTYIACGTWLTCVRPHRDVVPPELQTRRTRLALLAGFALMALCCSAAMTIKFTADIGASEMLRIHGRYYSFAITLCIVAMGCAWAIIPAGRPLPPTVAWALRLASLGGALTLLVVQFWWRRVFSIAPWDFPEIWSFALDDFSGSGATAGTILVVIAGLCFLAAFLRPVSGALFFLVFCACLDVSGLQRVTRWQFAHGQAFGPYSRPADAVHTLLSGPALDRGVVVGPDRGILTYTLFNLRSRSRVLLLPLGSTITSSTIGEDVDWVLLQGAYDPRLPGRTYLQTDKLTLIGLRPLLPSLH